MKDAAPAPAVVGATFEQGTAPRNVSGWPDDWLIAAVRREPPEEEALDVLVGRYWKALFARCQLLTLDAQKANDLAQETWYRVLRARRTLKPDGNFPARSLSVEPRLAPVEHQFRDTTRLYVRALDGVTRDSLLTRPGPRSNPLLWVAGHLVQQRTRLLGALGPARQIPWDDLFGTGSIIGDLQLYPSVGELDAVWRSATDELLSRLQTVSNANLAAPSPQWLRTQDGTLLGALAFAAMHEAYHVGQMGFLRKWLGLDSIFDG